MYEHLTRRPVQEEKDSRPDSRANYLNAPEKNGDKKFSLSDTGIQYNPRKTAQFKAHAFTQSSAALKKTPPRGVIQRAVWVFHADSGQWEKISRMDEESIYPRPENPVDGMVFNDNTNETFIPHTPQYATKFTGLMRRRHQRAIAGDYKNANRLIAFAEAPTKQQIATPFDPGEPIAQVYPVTRRGNTSYLATVKGLGKRGGNRRGNFAYDDVDDCTYPKGAFLGIRTNILATPGAPTQPFKEPLTPEQQSRLAGLEATQYPEEWRTFTAGTLSAAFTGAAEQHGYNAAKKLYPLAPPGGTQATRDILNGNADFSQEQADMFFPHVPPSPVPPPSEQSPPPPTITNYNQDPFKTTTPAGQTTPSFFIDVSRLNHRPTQNYPDPVHIDRDTPRFRKPPGYSLNTPTTAISQLDLPWTNDIDQTTYIYNDSDIYADHNDDVDHSSNGNNADSGNGNNNGSGNYNDDDNFLD